MKDGWDRYGWNLIADMKGRPLGHYKIPCAVVTEEIGIIRQFLISIQKGHREEVMSKDERCNMVFLAGKLKLDPKVYETQVSALLDVGQKSAIQVSIYTGGESNGSTKELAAKLRRFQGGDFIKLVAMLRPYGVKQEDGSWKNSMSIDITEIKTDPPKRAEAKKAVSDYDDNDVPF